MPRYLCSKIKFILFLLLNLMITLYGMAQNQQKIEGNWQGSFQLRFIFNISKELLSVA